MLWTREFDQDLVKNKVPDIVWTDSSSEDESFACNRKRRKICKVSTINSQLSNNCTEVFDDASSSPIIGWNSYDSCQISPELTQKEGSISPILEKRRVRLKKHKQMKEKLKQNSPLLFEKGTQYIESCSPSNKQIQNPSEIELFPSQFGSEVVPLNIELCNNLYYHPVKRKKQYRKNSLAYQVDKKLTMMKNRTKIWYHEKLNNINCSATDQDYDLEFQIYHMWKEYGNTVLECRALVWGNATSYEIKPENVLINVGVKSVLNIEWEICGIYRLYLPYNVEKIIYGGKETLYFCNFSRILKQ